LANCDLRGGIFTGCDLSDADFTDATLVDVGLANSNLKGANFAESDLTRADLKSGCTVYQLASHSDRVYAATSTRHLVRIDHADHGSVLITDVGGFSDAVFAVALSVREDLVVAGGQDGTIRGWDLVNNEPKLILRGHFSDIRSLTFAGSRIISGSVDGQVNIWSPWSAALINSFSLCGGEIWSLGMLNATTAAILCDRNHLHLMSILDGTLLETYDLPHGHTRRLIIDSKSNRLFVGGQKCIWMLDLRDRKDRLIEVPHPFVRTVFRTHSNGFLIGGAYSIVLWANEDFSDFSEVSINGKDYIADFAEYTNDTVLGSGAGGWLFLLERGSQGWVQKEDLGLLDSSFKLNVLGADFRKAKNVPEERKKMIAAEGALI